MMVTSRQQFSMLLLTQSDSQSFGHGVPFWKTNVPFILPHLSRYYQLNFLKCIIGPLQRCGAGLARACGAVGVRFIAPNSTSAAMSSFVQVAVDRVYTIKQRN